MSRTRRKNCLVISEVRWLLAAAIAICATSAAEAVPVVLSDGQLLAVTAGQTGSSPGTTSIGVPSGSKTSLPTRGGNPNVGSATGDRKIVDVRLPAGRELIAVSRSTITGRRLSGVALGSAGQTGLRTLNLINVARSDAVNVVNLYDGSSPAIRSDGLFSLRQTNILLQSDFGQARLDFASLAGEASTEVMQSGNISSSRTTFFGARHNDIFSQHVTTREQYMARVPGFDPFGDFSIRFETPRDIGFTLPGFGFNGIIGEEPVAFGVAAFVAPTRFVIPSINFGTVSFEGDDLVIAPGSLTLPTIKFGGVTGAICSFTCAVGRSDPFTVGGQTLTVPVPELRIAGGNPFKNFDLQIGLGLAAVGTGSFAFGDFSATGTAALTIVIPDVEAEIGFTVPGLSGGDPVDVSLDIKIPVPDLELDVTAFDIQFAGVSGTINEAAICLTFPAAADCGTLNFTKEESMSRINNVIIEEHFENSHFESRSQTSRTENTGRTELREAEAELIALGKSQINVEDAGSVDVTEAAQQAFRVMNAVNAASAMVGNGLNVSVMSAATIGSGSVGALRFRQTNSFTQIR